MPLASKGVNPFGGLGTMTFGSSLSTSTSLNTNNDDDGGDGEGGDEDVEEKVEGAGIQKAKDSDDEETLLTFRCKMQKFDLEKSTSTEKTWLTVCTGELKVMKDKTNGKIRLLMRNDSGMLKFNAPIFKGMAFKKEAAKKFSLFTKNYAADNDKESKKHILTLQEEAQATQLDEIIKKAIA